MKAPLRARELGASGIAVSSIGLGCNNLGGLIDAAASRKVVYKALDLGITLFDTANSYGDRHGSASGSESSLGELLGPRRKSIFLATKFGNPRKTNDDGQPEGGSRRDIVAALEGSLKRLRTDWIDLYQIHHPDPRTPIEETLRALDELVCAGKVRHIGCSNFPAWQAVEAQWTSRSAGMSAFITCQNEYSLLARGVERELIPAMERYGLGLLPYFPLACGLLTGKYTRESVPEGSRLARLERLANVYLTERNWLITERLKTFCMERGRSLLELAFSWLLARATVASVIAGATTPEQVEANVRAGGWALTEQDLARIDELTAQGA